MEPRQTVVVEPQVHFARRKGILKAHPEARDLAGPYWPTALLILLVVGGQFALSALFQGLPWWAILLLAYGVGAVLSHALYVLIHECTHNLVFKRPWANKVAGIVSDLPTVFPSAMTFAKYHMIHHRKLGEIGRDPDLAPAWEARLIGNSWWRKAIWLSLFSLSQSLRPLFVKDAKMWDTWTVVNVIVQIAVDVAVWIWIGPWALFYLATSTLFGLGLHPLGARWIQEHYTTTPGQETYSYYGPGNIVAFNIGYHNEHHDMMNVAWNRLPKLRRIAPEYYDNLSFYRSYTGVLLRFIFDPTLSPNSRMVRAPQLPAGASSSA